MLLPLNDALIILEEYKYWVIFPIAVIEGPIIVVITGFLVYLGYLNIFVAFMLLVLGDTVGDSINYCIGRYGKKIKWMRSAGYALGYNAKVKGILEDHFEKHTIKTLLLAKFSHGLGSIVQITAGISKINYTKYILIEIIGTIPKTLILFILGLYLGNSYLTINNYLNIIAFVVIGLVVCVVSYLVLNKYLKSYFK